MAETRQGLNGKAAPGKPITLKDLAAHKRLHSGFLEKLGLHDLPGGGVGVPYYDAAGKKIAVKKRTALVAKEGSFWPKKTPLVAYGQWKLAEANKAGFVVLVEGESDCWTLWLHGLPALGLPGADTSSTLEIEHVEALQKVYVHREPDQGGERFAKAVTARLRKIGFRGRVFQVRCPGGVKDPAELHARDPRRFLEDFGAAITSSTPLEVDDATGRKQASSDDGQQPEAWGELIARDAIPPAPFPLEALPQAMRDYVEQTAKALPCPVDMIAVAALGAASVAIGNARHVRINATWVEGPRLWLATVCGAGTMKSPALSAATRPVREAQRRHKREYDKAAEEYSRKKLAAKKEEAAEEPKEPTMRQVFTADVTREGLAALLEDNPRGLALIRDELTGWALGLNQYKKGKGDDRQFWLSLWSGGEVLVNRAKTRGKPAAYVVNPMLTVMGCLPPAVLGQLQDENNREDGFVHRILFSWPAEVDAWFSQTEPNAAAVEAYGRLFSALFDLEMSQDPETGEPVPLQLKPDRDATRVFGEFVNGLVSEVRQDDFPENLKGPWAKLRGYGARLALVLHACRFVTGETAARGIDLASMRNAVKLVNYFKAHARRVYPLLHSEAGVLLERNVQAVLDWIARRGEASFTWNACYKDLSNRFDSAEDLREVLKVLEEREYIRERPQERQGSTGRRPKPAYDVHPNTSATKPSKPSK